MSSPVPGRSLLRLRAGADKALQALASRDHRGLGRPILDALPALVQEPRTMSATRSTAALSSSSANRVAAIPADSCLLSLFVGCPGTSSVLAAVAPWPRPPLAKIVAGVVERGRVSVA